MVRPGLLRPASRLFVETHSGGRPIRLCLWLAECHSPTGSPRRVVAISRGRRLRRYPLADLQAHEPLALDLAHLLLDPGHSAYVVDAATVALGDILRAAESEAPRRGP